jgi:hypothetical protein
MLLCSDPLFTKPITVTQDTYYLPLGPGGQLYRNISGFFTMTGTTGTGPTPVPNASVRVFLNGYDSHGASWLLMDQTFSSNPSGQVTGLFPCTGIKNMIGVSGFISMISGNLTGLSLVNRSVTDMPAVYFSNFVTDSAGLQVQYDITNPVFLSLTGVKVQRASNITGSTYSTIFTTNLSPGATSPTQTSSIPITQGFLYRTSFMPPYASKSVESDSQSGGAPPPANALSIYWSGDAQNGYAAYLKATFSTGYSPWYDTMLIDYRPSGTSIWTSLGTANKYDGFFLGYIDSLTGVYYDFRVSGGHFDTFGAYFYSSPITGTLNTKNIELFASSSFVNCSVDLTWRGALGGPYTLQIALDGGISVGVTNVSMGSLQYYHHNTDASCGQLYYYRVSGNGSFSNIASGSGRYFPPQPDYTLTKVGTSGVTVNWTAMTDTRVDHISGYWQISNNPTGITGAVNFPFADSADTVLIPLNSGAGTVVEFRLYSVSSNITSADWTIHTIGFA